MNTPLVRVVFRAKDRLMEVFGREGASLLEIAHANKVPLQGACEGSLACSTCHVVLNDEAYSKLKPSLSEREEDLLDQAKGLTLTSRLGCQVKMPRDLSGMEVRIPGATVNVGDEIWSKKNKNP